MKLPFSVEQFYETFRLYNEAVWPVQVLLLVMALAAALLVLQPRAWSDRTISAILAVLWGWLGLAYHLVFFAPINPAAYGFAAVSVVGALVFLWQGVVQHRLHFCWPGGVRAAVGVLLVIYALGIYPVWSWFAGHHYPAMPTFGLPCPTTLFTIGLLAFAVPTYPRSVFIVPVLWCAVGAQAAFLLDVPQDLGLVVAGVVGLVLLVRSRATATAGGVWARTLIRVNAPRSGRAVGQRSRLGCTLSLSETVQRKKENTVSEPLSAQALDTLFREARSFSHWQDRPVSDTQLQALYALMKWGPTAANSCPARLRFIKSEEAKARLKPCLADGNVEKSMSAPVVAVIAMDLQFHEELPRLFPHTDARAWFAGKPEKIAASATLNTALQGAYLIMAARSIGLDCGPMSGFDNDALDAEFFPGGQVKSLFICALGYGERSRLHPRGPRMAFEEVAEIL